MKIERRFKNRLGGKMNTIKFPYEIIEQSMMKSPDKIDFQPFRNFIFNEFMLMITGFKCPDGVYDFGFCIEFNNDFVNASDSKGSEYPLLQFTVFVGEHIKEYSWVVMDNGNDFTDGRLYEINRDSMTFRRISLGSGEVAVSSLKIILFCLGYIMNYPRNHKQKKISSHRYSHEHRVSTKQNKIYLFDDIVKYVSDNYIPENGHHNIQCPCWEVRGHYRHYKSGKVIFIPSYRKGKQRDTAQPKNHEYYV